MKARRPTDSSDAYEPGVSHAAPGQTAPGDTSLDRDPFGRELDLDAWFKQLQRATRPGGVTLGALGEYELLSIAGRGGQGLVYRARQPRTGRVVAIKRIAAGIFATPEMRIRFEREIEAAAALEHTNIVTVFGSDLVEDQPVLAMQWIDGRPFDRWAAEIADPRIILTCFVGVCAAIHHAHQRGVIHRDIKPSNVLVDDANQPHVLDFGLAKVAQSSAAAPSITQTAHFIGTPAYAAPEQLRGDAAVDVRTDVYALGSMLYQALTDRTVIDPALPIAQLIEQAGHAAPAPSSINGRLDRDVDAIVLKAIAGDKELRYASVAELGADAQRYLDGQPVLAHPPTLTYRLRKFVRQHALAVGVTVSIIALLLIATTVSTTLYFQADREHKRAEDAADRATIALAAETRAFDDAQREAKTNRAMNDFFRKMLQFSGQSGQVAGGPLTLREMLNRAAERLADGRDKLEPAVEASLRVTVADAYRQIGLEDVAEPHYVRALELRTTLFGRESEPVAESLDVLGRCYRRLGRLSDAEQMIKAAWDIRVKVLPPNDGYFALTANSLGLLNRSLARWDEAERWYLESLARYRAAFGPKDESIPAVLANLAQVELAQDRASDAEQHLREAVSLAREIHGDAPQLDTLAALGNLADVLGRRGDAEEEAEALFCTTIAQLQSLVGDPHPRVAWTHDLYAAFLRRAERFDDSAAQVQAAGRIWERMERWEDAIKAATTAADDLRAARETDGAAETCRHALALAQAHEIDKTEIVVPLARLYARVLADSMHFEEAESELLKLQSRLAPLGDAAAPQLAEVDAALAELRGRDRD